jgi:dTDP-4-dehydrorhamnose reductase
VKGYTRTQWDVTDEAVTWKILTNTRPDVVVHCAAYTDVDRSQTDTAEAHRVNGRATRQLASACGILGARLVYISTDYVFDGTKTDGYTESDRPHPINVYGRTKRLGERWVQRCCPRHMILRTSWLYGTHGRNFVSAILSKAKEGGPLHVVNDQRGCPTYTGHLAQMIDRLIHMQAQGIFHTAHTGSCTWYQFAEAILQHAGYTDIDLQPISTAALGRPAPRPAVSVLHSVRIPRLGLPLMPDWREGLAAYFRDRQEGEEA